MDFISCSLFQNINQNCRPIGPIYLSTTYVEGVYAEGEKQYLALPRGAWGGWKAKAHAFCFVLYSSSTTTPPLSLHCIRIVLSVGFTTHGMI